MQTKGTDLAVTAVVIATVNVTFTLSAPASLAKDESGVNLIPQILSVGANAGLPTAVAIISPTQVRLTYAATQAASTQFIWPNRDPAVRSYSGGYVVAGATFP